MSQAQVLKRTIHPMTMPAMIPVHLIKYQNLADMDICVDSESEVESLDSDSEDESF